MSKPRNLWEVLKVQRMFKRHYGRYLTMKQAWDWNIWGPEEDRAAARFDRAYQESYARMLENLEPGADPALLN